jgi:hypothetical protein
MLGDPHAPDAQKIVYWRNARRCFGATNDLQNAMEYSTFSFCSPFRTPRWWETPSLQRNMIAECSKPILHQIIEDCHPEVVILSGKQSVAIFSHISGLPLHGRSSPAGGAGARTWAAFTGHGHWGEFLALQVPHFSVFNSLDGLKSCGEWLTSIICEGKSP